MADRKRSLPVAFVGGVLLVIVLYMLIATVVVGHLDFAAVAKGSDFALSLAAREFSGSAGFVAIAVAALVATSSAINATFYSTGRLAYFVSTSGQLPGQFKASFRGNHPLGTVITAMFALAVVNWVPLEAIATMGSAGFLLIFLGVNLANVRLARETGSLAWLSLLAAFSAAFALVFLCIKVDENPATREHLWILVGMIVASLAIEVLWRRMRGRQT